MVRSFKDDEVHGNSLGVVRIAAGWVKMSIILDMSSMFDLGESGRLISRHPSFRRSQTG